PINAIDAVILKSRIPGRIGLVVCLALLTTALRGRGETNQFPAIPMILSNIAHNATLEQASERAFKARYSYLRTRVTREYDGKGRVTKETTKINPNNPTVATASYTRVITNVVENTSPPKNNKGPAFEKSDFVLNDELFRRF